MYEKKLNKSNIDLYKGKSLFYQYKGNTVGIEMDLGQEYKNCNVPNEIEKQWKEEILRTLLEEIKMTEGAVRVEAINCYIYLIINENVACDFLIDCLGSIKLDAFSRIILCETLENYLQPYRIERLNKDMIESIKTTITHNIYKLLKEPIVIDNSFKQLSYMHDYDFSEANIHKRINLINSYTIETKQNTMG